MGLLLVVVRVIRLSEWVLRRVNVAALTTGMDAIDGKQARRLGMGSALGEMFDHGCGEYLSLVEISLTHRRDQHYSRGDPRVPRPRSQPFMVDRC